ncbi:hypothetical protein D7322_25635 [Sphingobacterium puteale]|uniref:DUF2178 domain-containing protein n=1 Tax=Sphingobacterium puteale TaxID=2420510 RepID=A0A420VR03_9SPHI|nr:hypothetical protein [Sphingobacterium puteale]RKO68778.1 hypothetical protein D7322_25635 [Sphingobacterium puteale]
MKKIFTLFLLIATATVSRAQGNSTPMNDQPTFQELMRSTVILVLIYLLTNFILALIKTWFDNRLKKKIIESGTSDTVVAQILTNNSTQQPNALKWFCVLTTAAIGLAIVGFYQLNGVYTLSAMALSVAVGYLGFYFLIRRISD